jgi:hypothetical protein
MSHSFMCAPSVHQSSFINSSGHNRAATDWAKENLTVRKTISLVLALVFVLSFGSLAFAQNSNSSTPAASSGGGMKHHRKHRRHHRRHSMKKTGGNTNM